jgi:hypothetical protein
VTVGRASAVRVCVQWQPEWHGVHIRSDLCQWQCALEPEVWKLVLMLPRARWQRARLRLPVAERELEAGPRKSLHMKISMAPATVHAGTSS